MTSGSVGLGLTLSQKNMAVSPLENITLYLNYQHVLDY